MMGNVGVKPEFRPTKSCHRPREQTFIVKIMGGASSIPEWRCVSTCRFSLSISVCEALPLSPPPSLPVCRCLLPCRFSPPA